MRMNNNRRCPFCGIHDLNMIKLDQMMASIIKIKFKLYLIKIHINKISSRNQVFSVLCSLNWNDSHLKFYNMKFLLNFSFFK